MRDLYFFKQYLEDTYGQALYRIPISLPLSCPNRVKNNGVGCSFCAEDGSAARHLRNNLNLEKQVAKGIAYAKDRYNAKEPYIAYFQAFTNTYAPVDVLKKYYSEVLSLANFKMIMISTRSDALPDDVLDYLSELNEQYDLWIELGVQSSNNDTLKRINRGETFESVQNAVNKLNERKIKVAAHIILGLPGEDIEDYRQTARDISALPFSAVKIHHLMVLKNTPLAKSYANGEFKTLNEYEYAAALLDVLKILPDNWPLMRIAADAGVDDLIAPKWWMKKGQFISYVKSAIKSGVGSNNFSEFDTIPKIKTDDGSFTFYHPKYKQHFHTLAGAKTEAIEKFIEPARLKEKLQNGNVNLLDIGFGLGYNAFEAINCASDLYNENNLSGTLTIHTLEMEIKTLKMSIELFDNHSFEYQILSSLIEKGKWESEYCTINLHLGDARKSIIKIKENRLKFDVVFLDGFSPDKNPELWSYDFFRHVVATSNHNCILVSYSSAFPVRAALIRCGLTVGETNAYGRKRGGTIASLNNDYILEPLNEKNMEIITKSTAGLCYRDIWLSSTAKKILQRRNFTQKRLRLRGVPKWIK